MAKEKKFSNLEKIFSPFFPLVRSKLQEPQNDGEEAIPYMIDLMSSAGLDVGRLVFYGVIAYYLSQ